MKTDCTPRRVSANDLTALSSFLSGAGASLNTFRYFSHRPLTVVADHLATWLLVADGGPVAYGHLDPEDDIVWLGLAVQEQHQRRGYGRAMMHLLLHAARGSGVRRLTLSVDSTNVRAIALYEAFGFRLRDRADRVAFFVKDLTAEPRYAVSSIAFAGDPVEGMLSAASGLGFALEFSSGLPHRKDMESVFLEAATPRLAHNYFPAPAEPFVLNLASADPALRQRSTDHCVRGVELANAVGAPFFSAHAGFCVDPRPEELGRAFDVRQMTSRDDAQSRFLESIREVLRRTFHCAAGFLIENNVLTAANHARGSVSQLLGVEAEELLDLARAMAEPRFGLLCDTGHLKVSARTLGFDMTRAATELLPHTRCVHHSDNDGTRDDNAPFSDDYWYLSLMPRAAHAVHVLEVRGSSSNALAGMAQRLSAASAS